MQAHRPHAGREAQARSPTLFRWRLGVDALLARGQRAIITWSTRLQLAVGFFILAL